MFAKLVGVATAVAVFLIYFWWRGVDPVLETVVGLLLVTVAGLWAWWATDRRQAKIEHERRALSDDPDQSDRR